MSLLEQIEAQAKESGERRAILDEANRAREAMDAQRARPLLRHVETYLRRMARALNDSDELVKVNYELPELGELKELRQANYHVAKEPHSEDELRFHFECSGSQPIKAALRSEELARVREAALRDGGLRCQRVAQSGQRRVLMIEPRVPVTLIFARSGPDLTLRTRNLSAIETRKYRLPPERVDEEFLEALLEVILRRGNRIRYLMGDTVPEIDREELRKELAREKRRRSMELSGTFSRAMYSIAETFRRLVLRQ